MARFRTTTLIAAVVAVAAGGCRDEPRTRQDVFRDQLEVETLYFTADGERIYAPGADRGMIVDDSGRVAFAAWQCENPDCPGRTNDKPFLFPLPDPFAYVDDKGQVAIGQPISDADMAKFEDFIDLKCPACLPTRDRERETAEQRQQYQSWVTRHVTPKAQRQLAELEEELRTEFAPAASR